MVSKYISSKKPIFVAGGSKGVGMEVVKQLTSMGNPVKCLVRRQESVDELKAIGGDLVTCQVGDAMDESDVQSCMEGCIAAVTTLGGKPEAEGGKRVDYFGNSNVVEQAGILGCERIILVTSIGCGSTKDAISEEVYKVLEDALVAKNKAERDCRMYTNLDWTIIRPGGLKSEPATGTAVLTDDTKASGVINRADVATLIIKALESEGKATRKELSALDPSAASDYNAGTGYSAVEV
jgi:nucleoside-diphosphate-sugar epimerase